MLVISLEDRGQMVFRMLKPMQLIPQALFRGKMWRQTLIGVTQLLGFDCSLVTESILYR